MDTSHQLLQMAEAVRDAAAKLIVDSVDVFRRQGHRESADARTNAAKEVKRMNLLPLVEAVAAGPLPVNVGEQRAFEAAAWSARINVTKHNGEFFYPAGTQAQIMWQAGVRWGRGQGELPAPLAANAEDTPDVTGFRTAARWLLANHSTEQARIIFDQELQRTIHGEEG